MIKNLKKKKAFTLVEVIIVLAIIAIIAAIAIPNLTKVRTESKRKADTQSCETIRRTILTLITEDSIKVDITAPSQIIFEVDETTGKIDTVTVQDVNLASAVENDYIQGYFTDIKAPQADGAKTYNVIIDEDGEVHAAAIDESGEVIVGSEDAALQ